MPVNVSETESGYVVRATMLGVRPEDIQIYVQGNRLTLRAQSQSEREELQGEYVLMRERHTATYYRALALPAPVNSEQADAHYEQGVLTLTLPRARQASRRRSRCMGAISQAACSSRDRLGPKVPRSRS
jgi:HSP20 family protein